MKIADNSGTWYVNRAQFPMFDSDSKTRFEPGEPTKATVTAWLKAQPTMEICADPSIEVTDKVQAKIDQANAAADAEREAATALAEAARLAAIQPPPSQSWPIPAQVDPT